MTQASSRDATGLAEVSHDAADLARSHILSTAPQSDPGMIEQQSKDKGVKKVSNIEQRRRAKVDGLRRDSMELHAGLLKDKEPWTYTHEERLAVSHLRMRLNEQIKRFNSKRKAPYLNQLTDDLRAIRDTLAKHIVYESEAIRLGEKRKKGAEAVRRFKTRQKAKMLGINIPTKVGRKPLIDNAHPMIKAQRLTAQRRKAQRSTMARRFVRQRMYKTRSEEAENATLGLAVDYAKDQPKDLLQNGWRHKKRRS